MIRRPACLALLLSLAATPALAEVPFACRIGTVADDSALLAKRFDLVVLADPPRGDARSEYRMLVRNPHPWPAAVLTGIDLPGLIQPPAEPVTVPAETEASVLIGWFPLDISAGRMAPPMIEAVRAAMTIPYCMVLRPDAGAAVAPSAGLPVATGRLQIVGDEGAHQIGQRL